MGVEKAILSTPAVLVTQLCCLQGSHLQLESSWTSYFPLALSDDHRALCCRLSSDGSGPEGLVCFRVTDSAVCAPASACFLV